VRGSADSSALIFENLSTTNHAVHEYETGFSLFVVSESLLTPSGVTEADVLQAFPGAEGVILHQNKQKGEANGWATVTLQTGEAAVAAVGGAVWHRGIRVPRMGFVSVYSTGRELGLRCHRFQTRAIVLCLVVLLRG